MASSLILKNFIAPNTKIGLTRSVIAVCPKMAQGSSFSRFYYMIDANSFKRPTHEDVRLVKIDIHNSIFRDVSNIIRTSIYFFLDFLPFSYVSRLRNFLNSVDVPKSNRFLWPGRWNVRQSAQALYLSRDSSGLVDEDFSVYVQMAPVYDDIRQKHYLGPWRGFFGQCLVYRLLVIPRATLVIERKGRNGCKVEGDIGRYIVNLGISEGDIFITSGVKIEEKNQMLNIIIPKVNVNWMNGDFKFVEYCKIHKE